MPASAKPRKRRQAARKRQAAPRSARCRNGISPISIRRSTLREVKRDLDRADAECVAFEEAYKGKLAALADGPEAGRALAEAVKRYEALDDLLGRLDLLCRPRPRRQHHRSGAREILRRRAGAHHRGLDASPVLHARAQPHRRRACSKPRWPIRRSAITGPGSRTSARRSPISSRIAIEQLFHEKSVTGLFGLEPAVRRDDREPALQGRRQVARDRADAQSAAGRRREEAQGGGRGAGARPSRRTCALFTLITNTLAKDKEISDRWRGFTDVADARHLANRVEPEVVEALVAAVRAAYPRLSHRYYALKARWFGKKRLPHWDRNAPLPKVATPHHRLGRGARHRAHRLWRVLAEDGGRSPSASSRDRWIDAPVRPGKAPGAFAHPTVPSAHPYVLLNYQGKPRDVMTLAHELGHGVHQVLAAPNGAADGADAADAGRDRERVRRDADLQEAARRHHRQEAAQGHARRQGRGHDQHGGAADRVLHVRAQGPHRAPQRRTHRRADLRDLDGGAAREPRPGDRAASRATRPSGPTSRTSSIRRSTSTPMRSAIAW